MMTNDEKAELALLDLASDLGKFAVPVSPVPESAQLALERMQLRRWVTLVDVCPLTHGKGLALYRIFLASDDAMAWRATARGEVQ